MVAQNLLRDFGSLGTDSEALQRWNIIIEGGIKTPRTRLETYLDWIANGSPLWAAYRAFMSDCMSSLDEQPGMHLVGDRET